MLAVPDVMAVVALEEPSPLGTLMVITVSAAKAEVPDQKACDY